MQGFSNRKHPIVQALALLALVPLVYLGNPAYALLLGMALTLILNVRLFDSAKSVSAFALQSAIVLLGFSLNISDLVRVSANYTAAVSIYVTLTLVIGLGIGILLKVREKPRLLVSSGTAICGGTTIATLAPIIRAEPNDIGPALAIVFILNALALFSFPVVGQYLSLTQEQFGVWAALAIHDTSSVVATAQIYGAEAAEIATTVKLGRTLWLIPMVLLVSIWFRTPGAKLRLPGFIVLFVLASMSGSLISVPGDVREFVSLASKSLLVIALFCVGLEITRDALEALRGRLLILALSLWALVVPSTLYLVMMFVP